MRIKHFLLSALITLCTLSLYAQGPDEDQLGAWYMYFFNKSFENSQFGIQGDYQFRFWDFGADREQILLRTGVTYRPQNANIQFTQGYGFISTGAFGESTSSVVEHRIYQEALFPQKIGNRFLLTHRVRYEQRFVENQDFRTRYRYNLFLNVPFNDTSLGKGVVYAALYNELFINGQTDIGDGLSVQYFDRNRTYVGVGYGLLKNMRAQLGWMRQTTVNWAKNQAQISIHHSF
ncbi:DUF2490 domain-containing protein [Marinoscillum furvescens]|uniref:Uncharacterized protein DUF2490 n=1 Tax=Marinoscillum furvescens DSM 4134 TaxID=1122208 RepID=A0A3D9KYR1_MARFU|nr:DUF2490 domain-containing protein [Marinoscillum furvescens]RED94940.1 uncharacterized protein DUF2490 [Marinoscillum furvescens DSM 4134]